MTHSPSISTNMEGLGAVLIVWTTKPVKKEALIHNCIGDMYHVEIKDDSRMEFLTLINAIKIMPLHVQQLETL